MVTIYDIALRSGYSPATVSKALNDYSDVGAKTKVKIHKIAKELGYTPNYNAKALITKKSWLIGVLYSEDQGRGLEHPLFGGIVDGFKHRVEEEGYEIIFITRKLGGKPMSYLEHCRYRGVDAVFLTVVDSEDPEVMELINSDIFCVSSDYVHPNLYSVISDNRQGARDAMNYLLGLGHRKIAHITGPLRHIGSTERLEVYKQCLQETGLTCYAEYVVSGENYDNRSGYLCMQQILENCRESGRELPTAVFAVCDTMAIGAVLAAREQGYSVPLDLSVIGFDDYDIAEYFNPPLTTVKQYKRQLGAKAAEILLTLIRGESYPERDTRLPMKLKVRSSCIPCSEKK